MKAAYRTNYGPPEVLTVVDIAVPAPNDDELLVKVCATTVNRTDCGILTAKPFIMRFFTGLVNPTLKITGTDFSGTVTGMGKSVNGFSMGDRVWGFSDNGLASHAEYLTVSTRKAIMKIPDGISFHQAAASAEAAHYAYHFIKNLNIKPGQKILVNGATGGIGSTLVQYLKYFDAHVTAVCHTQYIELVRSLGADKIIDYAKEDFTKCDETFDVVLDAVGKSSFFKCRRLLNPNGKYLSSELGPYAQNIYLPFLTWLSGGRKVIFPLPLDIKASLVFIDDLIRKGKYKPVIDRVYTLEEIQDAFRYVAAGMKTGNVIVDMGCGGM